MEKLTRREREHHEFAWHYATERATPSETVFRRDAGQAYVEKRPAELKAK